MNATEAGVVCIIVGAAIMLGHSIGYARGLARAEAWIRRQGQSR